MPKFYNSEGFVCLNNLYYCYFALAFLSLILCPQNFTDTFHLTIFWLVWMAISLQTITCMGIDMFVCNFVTLKYV